MYLIFQTHSYTCYNIDITIGRIKTSVGKKKSGESDWLIRYQQFELLTSNTVGLETE